MKKCKVPGCTVSAEREWAMVPLCKEHLEDIRIETHRYYNGIGGNKVADDERVVFHSIRHLIPWARKR